MTSTTVGTMMLGGMFILVAMRAPMTAAMLLPGAVGYWAMASEAALVAQLQVAVQARLADADMRAIALFLLMGQLALHGGLAPSLFKALAGRMEHSHTGIERANVLAAAVFGPLAGSSDAATATATHVAYPTLKRSSARGQRSAGLLAASGSLGMLLPPSLPLLAYAMLAQQSLAKLFVAALVPAVLATGGYLLVIGLRRRPRAPAPPGLPRTTGAWQALAGSLPVLSVVVLVLGTLLVGMATPVQAAAMGACAIGVTLTMQRALGPRAMLRALLGTLTLSAMVFMVVVAADVLHAALAQTALPHTLATWVLGLPVPAWLCLAAMLAVVIALCALLDELAVLLLSLPLLLPMVLGLDLWGLGAAEKTLWFGILVLAAVQIGLVLPPIGRNLHVVRSICRGIPSGEVYRGAMPFVLSDMVRLGLLLGFPALSLGCVRWCFP